MHFAYMEQKILKNHLKIDDFQYYSVLLHRKFLIVKI